MTTYNFSHIQQLVSKNTTEDNYLTCFTVLMHCYLNRQEAGENLACHIKYKTINDEFSDDFNMPFTHVADAMKTLLRAGLLDGDSGLCEEEDGLLFIFGLLDAHKIFYRHIAHIEADFCMDRLIERKRNEVSMNTEEEIA